MVHEAEAAKQKEFTRDRNCATEATCGLWDPRFGTTLCIEPVYAPKLGGDFVSQGGQRFPLSSSLCSHLILYHSDKPNDLFFAWSAVPQVQLIVEVVESSKRQCNVVLALFRSKYVASAPCHSSIFRAHDNINNLQTRTS